MEGGGGIIFLILYDKTVQELIICNISFFSMFLIWLKIILSSNLMNLSRQKPVLNERYWSKLLRPRVYNFDKFEIE